MVPPKSPSETGQAPGGTNSLPLFREEAVAAQRQEICGEVVRIRPFSIASLAVLVAAVALVIFGFLWWARHTGQLHLSGWAFERAISIGI